MKIRIISLIIAMAMIITFIPWIAVQGYATPVRHLTDVKVYDSLDELTESYFFEYEGDFLTKITHQIYGEYAEQYITNLSYDSYGRLLSNVSTTPERPEISSGSDYTYNSAGQLTSNRHWEGGMVEEKYEYDAAGRRIRTRELLDWGEKVTDYIYDEDGKTTNIQKIVAEKWSGGEGWIENVEYRYDSQKRLIKETSTGGYTDSVTTYDYRYQPFVLSQYKDEEDYSNKYLRLQDSSGLLLWSCYLSDPEFYTDKNGNLIKIVDIDDFSGEEETMLFSYNENGNTDNDVGKTMLEHYYIPAVEKAIEDISDYAWESGWGTLYDVDGNGIEELILVYTADEKNGDGFEFPARVCSVYTMSNGKTIGLIDKEMLFSEAGGPSGHVDVVERDGSIYFAISSQNISTGENGYNSYGDWNLYKINGTAIQLDTEITYEYYTEVGWSESRIIYDRSSASINGKVCSYKEYETWENELTELFRWDAYDEEAMTLEELLEYLRSNPVISEETSNPEGDARDEWTTQHMEYAASEKYKKEIVKNFNGCLHDVVDAVRDNDAIKSYTTLDSINQILSFDIDLSETQEYELLFAQIFFSYIGEESIEKIYAENMAKSVITIGETVLGSDDYKNIGDSEQLQGILKVLKGAEDTEEISKACDQFFDFIDGYDNIDVKKYLVKKVGNGLFDLGWNATIDSLDLVTTTMKELSMYIAAGEAYMKTSDAFGDMLLAMRRNIEIPSDNPIFSPLGTKDIITDEMIWNMTKKDSESIPNPLNTPVVLKDLAAAIENFYTSIETYKNEDSSYIAKAAVAELKDGAFHDVFINNCENAAVSLLSCLPIIREYAIIRDILSTGQAVINILTSVEDQEYLGTMLLRLYCISHLQYIATNNLAEGLNNGELVFTPIWMQENQQDPTTLQFGIATSFDEAVNVYKSISVVAADYATQYTNLLLKDALFELDLYDTSTPFEQLFKNREKIVEAIAQYRVTLKELEKQVKEIKSISCHDSDLYYDPVNDAITCDFKESRIYVVACPVDVIVTTDSGEQIAYLSDENSEVAEGYEFYFHTIKSADDSGEYIKIAIVPNHYEIELKGTGKGVMHAFVADFTEDSAGEVETYFNVPISKNSKGSFEVSADNSNAGSLTVDRMTYSNMIKAEDIPAGSTHSIPWLWIGCGAYGICGVITLLVVMKRRKSKK